MLSGRVFAGCDSYAFPVQIQDSLFVRGQFTRKDTGLWSSTAANLLRARDKTESSPYFDLSTFRGGDTLVPKRNCSSGKIDLHVSSIGILTPSAAPTWVTGTTPAWLTTTHSEVSCRQKMNNRLRRNLNTRSFPSAILYNAVKTHEAKVLYYFLVDYMGLGSEQPVPNVTSTPSARRSDISRTVT